MEHKIKSKLSLYGIISGIAFIILILTSSPSVSVPIFFIIQFVCLFYIARTTRGEVNIKGLLLMIPIFIISLNNFISANYLLRPINFLVIVFLYSLMFLLLGNNLNLLKLNILEIFKTISNIFEPFINFMVPFTWLKERSKNKERNMLAKRIALGLAVSIPCVLFLVVMLSSADMVFQKNFISFNMWVAKILDFLNIFKIIIGTFVGLYLFGHLYSVISRDNKSISDIVGFKDITVKQVKGDVIVLNILLVSILVIYTIFIGIQFRYLFSAGALPEGLNYAEYARRGFFELVFLSVLNIALILLTTYLLKDKIYVEKNKWATCTKMMLIYLCIVTGIMLVSSYYRMSLYDSAYGFTRLRVLVYMFLVFEAVGLVATLAYIVKYNFNILVVYASIALVFYMTLNVVKIDEIIAKRNIDMYFTGQAETVDMDYLITLSPDAVPQLMRLMDKDVEIITRNKVRMYLESLNERYDHRLNNWQSYNLSVERNKSLLEANKDKLEFKY